MGLVRGVGQTGQGGTVLSAVEPAPSPSPLTLVSVPAEAGPVPLQGPLPTPVAPQQGTSKIPALRTKVDGVRFVKQALRDIRQLKKKHPEVRPVVVFDLDNTIFETRARTIHALKAYDEAHGTKYFAHVKHIHQVGKNGAHSAELAGLPPELCADVQSFWLGWFWKGEHFQHDVVFPRVVALAKAAKEAGAEVIYLTGRVDRPYTLDELKRAELPDADEAHLMTKGFVGANTGDFKATWFKALLEDPKVHVGWFMTEGCRDIQALQNADSRIPCVRLGYVHEQKQAGLVQADTPYVPESWTHHTRPLKKR